MNRRANQFKLFPWVFACVSSLAAASAGAQEQVLMFRVGGGAALGAGDDRIEDGAGAFSFRGSNWEGGEARALTVGDLFSYGVMEYVVNREDSTVPFMPPEPGTDISLVYVVESGEASVTFDEPVTAISFFYSPGGKIPIGVTTAFNANGEVVDQNASNTGDNGKPISFTTSTPIARVSFTGGVISDFMYTIPAPVTEPPVAQLPDARGETALLSNGGYRETLATIAIGATRDGGAAFVTESPAGETLEIIGAIVPEPDDVGGSAEIFIVIGTETNGATVWTMKDAAGNFVPWDTTITSLVPAVVVDELPGELGVTIFFGLPVAGEQRIFLGYMTSDGPLIFNGMAQRITINE